MTTTLTPPLSAALRDALAGFGHVDLVEPEWLHLTMTGVGWSDELDDDADDASPQAAQAPSGRAAE